MHTYMEYEQLYGRLDVHVYGGLVYTYMGG